MKSRRIHWTRARRWSAAALLMLVAAGGSCFIPLSRDALAPVSVQSLQVEDRRGIILRTSLNDRQGRGQWRSLDQISLDLRNAVVAAEDRRFRWHPGVDPLAIIRAAVTNVRAAEIRSGGSTLTQQVVRNVFPLDRSWSGKTLEAWYALRLERMCSKDEILEQYLNRVPFGNQTFGAEAAAQLYFRKPASDLSLAESAYLAALPNAPSTLNPYRNPGHALARQHLVLQRMRDQSYITQEEFDRAVVQAIRIVPAAVSFRAPHAVVMALAEAGTLSAPAAIRTTIDDALQSQIEEIIRSHLRTLAKRNVTNAAVVVIENAAGAVRALAGSADFFDESKEGEVNGALALRQPGSAIKPMTYALAFEGGMNASDVVADVPVHLPDNDGDYIPENYDRQYHGPVRLRTALACSYNIPAVRILQQLGKEVLRQRLPSFGFTSITESGHFYGLGLTLGNADVRLIELTNAYAMLARGGLWKPTKLIERVRTPEGSEWAMPEVEGRRVLDARAAFLVTDILADPVARRPAFGHAFRFPFPCAVKTGTTKDYRDNWTVGFTPQYTVGVWVGNFDGSPMRGVSGVTGAGAVFTDVMIEVNRRNTPDLPELFSVPDGLVRQTICSISGLLPGRYCTKTVTEWFKAESPPRERCRVHRLFRMPGSGEDAIDRVYEIFPPEYARWMEEQRIPRPPEDAFEIPDRNEARPRRTAQLSIVAPNNGSLFKIDPFLRPEYQAVKIEASLPEGAREARLKVDGNVVSQLEGGGCWWPLRKGVHRLELVAKLEGRNLASHPVIIRVD